MPTAIHTRRRFALLGGLTAVLILGSTYSAAQDAPRIALDSALDEAVDRVAQPLIAKQEAVGYAVGVVREGSVVCLRGYGMADRESNVPVDRKAMFRWGSISKPVTAIATLQLFEQGKLDLDADVRDYVPEFPDKGVKITSRQLLSHLGGIRHYTNGKIVPNERKYTEEHPFESVILAIDEFKDSPLVAKPGERFSYSTHGYILLSAVVERAGEQPFAEQVRQRIGKPLGLATLQPDYQWIAIPNRAVGYRKRQKMIEPSSDTDVSWKLGGGGFISSIDDLALSCAAIARRDLLKPETWELATAPQANAAGQPTGYGLGFRVFGDGTDRFVGHSGAQEKTRTFLIANPSRGIGVVAMTNSEYGQPAEIANAVLKELFPDAVPAELKE